MAGAYSRSHTRIAAGSARGSACVTTPPDVSAPIAGRKIPTVTTNAITAAPPIAARPIQRLRGSTGATGASRARRDRRASPGAGTPRGVTVGRAVGVAGAPAVAWAASDRSSAALRLRRYTSRAGDVRLARRDPVVHAARHARDGRVARVEQDVAALRRAVAGPADDDDVRVRRAPRPRGRTSSPSGISVAPSICPAAHSSGSRTSRTKAPSACIDAAVATSTSSGSPPAPVSDEELHAATTATSARSRTARSAGRRDTEDLQDGSVSPILAPCARPVTGRPDRNAGTRQAGQPATRCRASVAW